MSHKDDFQGRLKKMKQSIDKNKELLREDFPDDVTYSGDPKLIKKENEKIDQEDIPAGEKKHVK